MEKQDYQKIFKETENLHGKQLEEKLLTFADGDQQMEEEMKAMFARIDEYYAVLRESRNDSLKGWKRGQMQKVVDIINERDNRNISIEEVEQMVNQEISQVNDK